MNIRSDVCVIKLSEVELNYLLKADFLPSPIKNFLDTSNTIKRNLNIPLDIIEDFRSAFTDRLAQVGFDANYNPNQEGKLLEQLIDLFYQK